MHINNRVIQDMWFVRRLFEMNERFEKTRKQHTDTAPMGNSSRKDGGEGGQGRKTDAWPVRLAPRAASMHFAAEELFDPNAPGPPIGVRAQSALFVATNT